MKPHTLSVVIATHNEEASIGKCLDSVKSIANEVLVADGESTDNTVKIAKEKGATVLPMSNKRMFHKNKEEAKKHAKSEWILFLDADEIITTKLAKEIQAVVSGTYVQVSQPNRLFALHMRNIEVRDKISFSQSAPMYGYFIARKNYFLGRFLMHSGVYPDGVIRLVKNGHGYWPCKDVHETMIVDGGVSWLQEPMIHMADPSFARYLARANRYTTLTADNLRTRQVGTSIFTVLQFMVWLPVKTFVVLFIRHKGFLDGFSGFVWSLMSGLHFPIAYLKYLQNKT